MRDNGVMSTFARDLASALERQLERYIYEEIGKHRNNYKVFLDEHVIKSGDWIVHEISEGLYRSVCWVVIYTNTYLGGSLFCASEFKGMTEIQKLRKEKIGALDNSLVIPILFGGSIEKIPKALRGNALADFRSYKLSVKNIAEHPDFENKILEIAEQIGQRHEEQCVKSSAIPVDLCKDYHLFKIEDVNSEVGKQSVADFIIQLKSPDFPII